MALTPKKRAFADALRGGASNKEAAIAAGYSASSASAAGSRLAKDPHVLAALATGTVNKNVKGKSAAKPATNEQQIAPEEVSDASSGGALKFSDPVQFLLTKMNSAADEKLQIDAAKALLPYLHQRKGETGKKEEKLEAAEKAAAGMYGTGKPPLRSVK
ncbi:terminase small subunit [Pseudomonas fluorescens]|uniref:Terminase small subunit n=1 Tax=Pseudomonas fluorescens TaxID=294 RepID=A0A5E7EV40_PSEFL|nr:terminase small subunit [Pseudomonas fluorescens]VVO30524.1 hypothetical protein PS723_04952 [Pseudomonas fluorescens]